MSDDLKQIFENGAAIAIVGTALFFIFGPDLIVWTVETLRAMGAN